MDSQQESRIVFWAILLLISGLFSFILPFIFSTTWGITIVCVAVFALLFREPAIYIIYSMIFLFLALNNFLVSLNVIGFWVYSLVQVGIAFWFFNLFLSSMLYYKDKGAKRYKFLLISSLILIAIIALVSISIEQLKELAYMSEMEEMPSVFLKTFEIIICLTVVGTGFGISSFLSENISKILSGIVALINLIIFGIIFMPILIGTVFYIVENGFGPQIEDEEEYEDNNNEYEEEYEDTSYIHNNNKFACHYLKISDKYLLKYIVS
ncbi:MAG: hypothetical protein AB1782_14260 [Cyanobacteriota bacterium]